MPKVLVTDASERAALAIIRSLGRKGIDVIAADSTRFNGGFLSKYCSHRIIYPSPQRNKRKFIDSMLHFVKNETIDLLIPVTDFTMIPIVERLDKFEKYVEVAAPPYEIAIKALDKAQTIKIAEKCGVPYPKTFLVEDLESLESNAKSLNFPVVIKPRMKVFWVREKALMLKVTHRNFAFTYRDLIEKYKTIMSQLIKLGIPNDFFLIQEYVRGRGYGVEALIHNSKAIALFMHKRIREYPVSGGASTLRISVKNKKLREYALTLLNAMNWQGVAMVEFRVDHETNDAKLIEINGRFWGSLPLAINTGVDFPYLLYKLMMNENFTPCFSYRVGIMQKWLIPGDLLWLLDSFLNGKGKLHTLKSFLSSLNVPDDVILPDDFTPTVGALTDTLRLFLDVAFGKRTLYGELLN